MKGATRWVLLLAGHAFVFLGVVGAFLPLLPTTPFLLLAAACYLRSSERSYRRLMQNRVVGPILRDYQQKRAVTRRTKGTALLLLWASLLFSIYRAGNRAVDLAVLAVGLLLSLMILHLPTLPEDECDAPE